MKENEIMAWYGLDVDAVHRILAKWYASRPVDVMYHSARHVLNALNDAIWMFEESLFPDGSLTKLDKKILGYAIVWHDAVCEPGFMSNEYTSALLAVDFLKKNCPDITDDLADACGALINNTAINKVKMMLFDDPDCTDILQPTRYENNVEVHLELLYALMHDADWIGMASYDVMLANEPLIEREFIGANGWTESDVIKGRVKFLSDMVGTVMAAGRMYLLPTNDSRGKQALINMANLEGALLARFVKLDDKLGIS